MIVQQKDLIGDFQGFRKMIKRQFGTEDKIIDVQKALQKQYTEQSLKKQKKGINTSPKKIQSNQRNFKELQFEIQRKLAPTPPKQQSQQSQSNSQSRPRQSKIQQNSPSFIQSARAQSEIPIKFRKTELIDDILEQPPQYKDWMANIKPIKEPHITDKILSYSYIKQLFDELNEFDDKDINQIPIEYVDQLIEISKLIQSKFARTTYYHMK